ncbi:MAG: hypothetical protein WCE81_02265 [Halobacteriota archaeon]
MEKTIPRIPAITSRDRERISIVGELTQALETFKKLAYPVPVRMLSQFCVRIIMSSE